MNCLIISCSHRSNSNSLRISKIIEQRVHMLNSQCQLVDLAQLQLPMWHEELWQTESDSAKIVAPFQQAVTEADALVWVVPEYAGMATPIAKNAMLMLDAKMVGHKPALLVSVSAGPAGSYPIAELRLSSFKNNRLLWIPDHLIIRYADQFKEPFEEPLHQQASKRLSYGLKLLHEYSVAMKIVRQSGILAEQPFANGL